MDNYEDSELAGNNVENIEETNVNDSNDNFDDSNISDAGWISWFCQMEGNEYFVEISEEYLMNPMNLFGISNIKKGYK